LKFPPLLKQSKRAWVVPGPDTPLNCRYLRILCGADNLTIFTAESHEVVAYDGVSLRASRTELATDLGSILERAKSPLDARECVSLRTHDSQWLEKYFGTTWSSFLVQSRELIALGTFIHSGMEIADSFSAPALFVRQYINGIDLIDLDSLFSPTGNVNGYISAINYNDVELPILGNKMWVYDSSEEKLYLEGLGQAICGYGENQDVALCSLSEQLAAVAMGGETGSSARHYYGPLIAQLLDMSKLRPQLSLALLGASVLSDRIVDFTSQCFRVPRESISLIPAYTPFESDDHYYEVRISFSVLPEFDEIAKMEDIWHEEVATIVTRCPFTTVSPSAFRLDLSAA